MNIFNRTLPKRFMYLLLSRVSFYRSVHEFFAGTLGAWILYRYSSCTCKKFNIRLYTRFIALNVAHKIGVFYTKNGTLKPNQHFRDL